jgi:hypothetical protein
MPLYMTLQHLLNVLVQIANKVGFKSKSIYDTVCLGVEPTLGLVTRYSSWKVAVWKLWSCFYGVPSLTRGRVCSLQCNHSMESHRTYFTVSSETPATGSRSLSYFMTDGQSVSMSWYRAPLWDLWPDITSCRNVAVWNLRSCFCGAPSLTRGWVCNLQCKHSVVQVAQNL